MTTPVERCAAACARRGDPLVGTAPPVGRWLLVEQPGPWGRDALHQSPLPAPVAASVAAQAAAVRARVLLIRRPGRVVPVASRRWAFADADGVRWSSFTDPEELTDLRLGELSPGARTPVYLVCTHGKHDRCCAIDGRPLAAALAAVRPTQVWECSHVGGDRFAGNLVVLPQGLYYGKVPPASAAALADRHDAGLLSPEWLRGQAGLPAAAQAAQHFARARLAEFRVEALPVLATEQVEHETWAVTLAGKDGDLTVTVRGHHHRVDTPLTCAARVPAAVREFTVVSITG
ncbi:sucrase ferredoxin [Labedaea rhizosphaerae]|uniref:Sucrase/ferredoxin-like protein n=1 Tax=Labedaea rhizosphaerae TaxID=598644 RepID=A0A4R6SFD4_LABRH|nr:sucrase ferredoxin [Labedaea rhizosphaerae]TDQ00187.1 hypothetical protein EV186_10248 [Labedaea rhizosphaerae]